MPWHITASKEALSFLEKNRLPTEEAESIIASAIRRFQGENENVDIVKLKGKWFGFFRVRKGKIRIIVSFDFDNLSAFIDKIDWRGNVYK
ncbi:MAG: hypothetical protein Q7S34_03500 [bacterium]|nr:hypothetical protein [bacterium]